MSRGTSDNFPLLPRPTPPYEYKRPAIPHTDQTGTVPSGAVPYGAAPPVCLPVQSQFAEPRPTREKNNPTTSANLVHRIIGPSALFEIEVTSPDRPEVVSSGPN